MAAYGHEADMAALPADYLERMEKGIVGIGLAVTRLETQGEMERRIAARMRANLER